MAHFFQYSQLALNQPKSHILLGAIHKRRRQFRGGGEGGQTDNMGPYEGGRSQKKPDIVNSKLADYNFLKMESTFNFDVLQLIL